MVSASRSFFVADFNPRGELLLKAEYRYEQLEQIPGAVELIASFSAALWRNPEEFDADVPGSEGRLSLHWGASASTAGLARLRCGNDLASLSLLAAGADAEADALTAQAIQKHLVQELHAIGFEPAFDLLEIAERPLVATINFLPPAIEKDKMLAALADRCFAASYFRYQGLV